MKCFRTDRRGMNNRGQGVNLKGLSRASIMWRDKVFRQGDDQDNSTDRCLNNTNFIWRVNKRMLEWINSSETGEGHIHCVLIIERKNWLCNSAATPTIISTAFPKEALSRPESVWPSCKESWSVASPSNCDRRKPVVAKSQTCKAILDGLGVTHFCKGDNRNEAKSKSQCSVPIL